MQYAAPEFYSDSSQNKLLKAESFHLLDESPSEGMVTSPVDFRRAGDLGGLGDNGGEW